ncbi:MAG: hypothetical protein LLG42_11810 [Chloroflexi bacterium]|nr:hypothetical protein [Chloroflexota bacterium]
MNIDNEFIAEVFYGILVAIMLFVVITMTMLNLGNNVQQEDTRTSFNARHESGQEMP